MFCTNCGKEISNDSVFCEHCGAKIVVADEKEKTVVQEQKNEKVSNDEAVSEKKDDEIRNEELRKMSEHLEFLGYSTRKLDVGEGKEWVVAKHPTNNTLLFFELLPNFVLFRASFSTGKKHSSAMDEAVNEANKGLNLAKFYYETEDDGLVSIKFESIYTGDYSKGTFARFHDFFDKEVTRLGQFECFQAFLNE